MGRTSAAPSTLASGGGAGTGRLCSSVVRRARYTAPLRGPTHVGRLVLRIPEGRLRLKPAVRKHHGTYDICGTGIRNDVVFCDSSGRIGDGCPGHIRKKRVSWVGVGDLWRTREDATRDSGNELNESRDLD